MHQDDVNRRRSGMASRLVEEEVRRPSAEQRRWRLATRAEEVGTEEAVAAGQTEEAVACPTCAGGGEVGWWLPPAVWRRRGGVMAAPCWLC